MDMEDTDMVEDMEADMEEDMEEDIKKSNNQKLRINHIYIADLVSGSMYL